MKIDVNKLLDLEYLNGLLLQINSDIDKNKSSFLQRYDLDILKGMDIESINSLFNQYGISNNNILQFIESDFIDEDWEFADLFSDDIGYSSGLREEVKVKALEEVDRLNSEITKINDNYQKDIDVLEARLQFVNSIIKILNNDGNLIEEDINNLNMLIIQGIFSDEDKLVFSYNVVKYLIEKNMELSKKETSVDTSEFEKMLDEVYTSTKYVDDKSFDKIEEPVYSETIMSSYNYYKKLFDEVKFGNTLTEIMNFANGLAMGVDASISSMSKDDFCIELASLLYLLNDEQKKERVNQDTVANLLIDLNILDNLYEEDVKHSEYKSKLLKDIEDNLSVINSLNIDCLFRDKIKNRLNLLYNELRNNLINSKRKEEIVLEYKNIRVDLEKLADTGKQLSELNKLRDSLINVLTNYSLSHGYVVNDDYIVLSGLQSEVLQLIDLLKDKGVNNDITVRVKEIKEVLNGYREVKNDEKVSLKGFVLFDFDENNKPYVIDDLNPSGHNNMIDVGVLQKKMNSSFEDYNTLINDLLVYGMPRVMKDGVPAHMDRILSPVFFENNSNHPTGMVRIRPLRNSLVRFVDQKVVLKANTEIQKQVVEIIQEILPSVEINLNEDFSLFINFCSAIKDADSDFYNDVISRYLRKSPLYNLFIADSEKTRLTDSECSLLRDIIHMSLNAYSELEKRNESLNFDIITQIGGKKTRV